MSTNPNPLPAAETEPIRGACPVCHSPIYIEAGAVKGGGPSQEFQELERKAASADEWRNKAAALEAEHTSRDIAEPPPNTAPTAGNEAENEYFL